MATAVPPIAVFQRDPQRGGEFTLESWHPEVTPHEVMKRTGFKLNASGAGPASAMPRREHQALSDLDPRGELAAEVQT